MARKPINKCSQTKPSFFKVLLGDFSKRLLIPPDFTKNLTWNEKSPRGYSLRGPSRQCWAVELERTENGLFFQNGWQCFVKDHHLELGDFLIFRYDGESKFTVIIYDRTACEKDVEVAKRRSDCSVPLRNKGNRARVKHEVPDLVTENFKNIDSKGNDVRTGKRPANGYLEETSDGSILFKSENSCFQKILKEHLKYHIGFPKELAVAKGLMNKTSMNLEDPTGRSWPVSVRISKCSKEGKLYERVDLATGWKQLCVANKISLGDTIIFELVNESVIKVHIISVGRMRGKGCSVRLVSPSVKSSV